MFKFSFNKLDDEKNQNATEKSNNIHWHEASEVIADVNKHNVEDLNTKIFECNDVKLLYTSAETVIDSLKNCNDYSSSVLKAETNHSDLVPGEYEGGLKIWECTSDLINHLNTENIPFANKKVLDLGCGAGMLGIYALLKGSLVDFQDYNNEVIECTTIPNVLVNLNHDEAKLKDCKFYSGDWNSFMNLVASKYDYILTSETIYNTENYRKLLDIFDQLLEANGVIYLAAKTYYFGVGGGIRQLEEHLNKDGIFGMNVCWKNSSGVQREILKIFKR